MARSYTRFTCKRCGIVEETLTSTTISADRDVSVTYTDIPNTNYPVTRCEEWYYGRGTTGIKARACDIRAKIIDAIITGTWLNRHRLNARQAIMASIDHPTTKQILCA